MSPVPVAALLAILHSLTQWAWKSRPPCPYYQKCIAAPFGSTQMLFPISCMPSSKCLPLMQVSREE